MEAEPVPLALRNAETNLMKNLGYGRDYQYAHDYKEHITGLQCLPDSLEGIHYYVPTDQGLEKRVQARKQELDRLRMEMRNNQQQKSH